MTTQHDESSGGPTLGELLRAELPPRETHGRRLALPPDAEYQARLPDRERVAVVLQHVLRRDEAQAVIDATEARGYEAALFGGTKAYNLRKSARCLAEDKDFADRLYARVREYLPPFWTDEFGVRWRLSGVDDRLRFLRYRGGDGFKPHRDGAQCTASDDRHSFMTLMLYLNDATPPGFNSEDFDCLGGCLGFLGTTRTSMGTSTESSTGGDTDPAYAPGGQGERVSFVQRAGDVVLFEHGILHEGEPVDTGVKYCMRTDIMYEAIPGEAPRAPPAHIVIDSGKGGDIRRLAPDGFVQHPLPPSSYVQFALGADEAAAASDGTAPPTRPPLLRVPSVETTELMAPLVGKSYWGGEKLELRGVDREVRLEDVVVTVTNAGKTDCNGVYVMYQKNGMVKPYAGRLMWKGLDSVVELAASPGAQPRSPYMIFWDGQVWWLGFGLYRNDNHDGPTPTLASDGTASGWLDHDKRPLPAGALTIVPSGTAPGGGPTVLTLTCPNEHANGEYVVGATENGKPRYTKGDGWFICYSGRNWWVSLDHYVCALDDGSGKPPSVGWRPYPAGRRADTSKVPAPTMLVCTIANRDDLEKLKTTGRVPKSEELMSSTADAAAGGAGGTA